MKRSLVIFKRRRLLTLLAVASALALAGAVGVVVVTRGSSDDTGSDVVPAYSANECAQRVLSDWFDNGRIDRRYRTVCFERARELIPDSAELFGLREILEERSG